MQLLFDRATVFFSRPVGYRVAPSSVTCGDSFPPRGSLGWEVVQRAASFVRFAPTWQGSTIAFPFGGRWAGEAGSDEGAILY